MLKLVITHNRLEIYTPTVSSKRVERFNMESGLRYALEREELTLHFQPLVSLSTGKVYGAETLLRWNTPDGRTIQPVDYPYRTMGSGAGMPGVQTMGEYGDAVLGYFRESIYSAISTGELSRHGPRSSSGYGHKALQPMLGNYRAYGGSEHGS